MRSRRSVRDTDRENHAPFEFTVLAIRAIDPTRLAEPGDLNLGENPPLPFTAASTLSFPFPRSACSSRGFPLLVDDSSRVARSRSLAAARLCEINFNENLLPRQRRELVLPLDFAGLVQIRNPRTSFLKSRVEANSRPRRRIPPRGKQARKEIKQFMGEIFMDMIPYSFAKHFSICCRENILGVERNTNSKQNSEQNSEQKLHAFEVRLIVSKLYDLLQESCNSLTH